MVTSKLFHAFDERPPIKYRPGTSDEAVIKAVIIDRNEYAFPKMNPQLVFDIGANIGVVSVVMANIFPGAKILAFEPEIENFKLLSENMASYKNVTPMNCGLGSKTETAMLYASEDPVNLGGYSNHIPGPSSGNIPIVSMAQMCDKVGTPDVIKIDCEGAEYDILTSIPHIEDVKWITGELHGVKDFALLDFLSKEFLIQTSRRFGDKVWHFHALSIKWVQKEEQCLREMNQPQH